MDPDIFCQLGHFNLLLEDYQKGDCLSCAIPLCFIAIMFRNLKLLAFTVNCLTLLSPFLSSIVTFVLQFSQHYLHTRGTSLYSQTTGR